jgi:hypothetical protein
VPAGEALTPSGSITVNTPGATVRNLDVTGTITVAASNVTIEDTRVTSSGGSGAWGVLINEGARGTTIQDSTVRGADSSGTGSIESAVFNQYNEPGTRSIRNHFYNASNPWEGAGTIRDSYMVVNGTFSGAHYEDIYVCGGSLNVAHNTLLNPQPQTATVFGDTICGPNRFSVTNNLLAGGGFMLYPAANSPSVGANTMKVTGNHFARCLGARVYNETTGGTSCRGVPQGGHDGYGYHPRGGYFGVAAAYYFPGSGQVWSDNKWDDDLQPVCPDGTNGCG